MAKIVYSTSVQYGKDEITVKLMFSSRPNTIVSVTIVAVISNLTLSDWTIIAVKNKSVHCGRPIEYQWIRNGTGVMVRKPPYSFKRLLNVYKVRLNVYKIKR